MVGGAGRRTRSQGRAAVIVTAPPLPPLARPLVEARPLPLDPVVPLHHHRPRLPRRPTAAAEVAAAMAVSVRGGHPIGAGRKQRTEVTAREEGVAEEGGTRKDRGRGGARKGGADHLGAIGSIKIETGRTRDANLFLNRHLYGKAGKHCGEAIYLMTNEMTVFKLALSFETLHEDPF